MLLYIICVVTLVLYVIIVHHISTAARERRIIAVQASLRREMHLLKRECDLGLSSLRTEFEARMMLMETRMNHIEDHVDSVTNRYSFPIKDQSKPVLQFDQKLLQMQGLLSTQSVSKSEIINASSTVDHSIHDGFFLSISATEPPTMQVSGTNNLDEIQPVSGLLTSSSFKIRYTIPHQFSAHNWLITDRPSVHETHNHRVDGLDFATEVLK